MFIFILAFKTMEHFRGQEAEIRGCTQTPPPASSKTSAEARFSELLNTEFLRWKQFYNPLGPEACFS